MALAASLTAAPPAAYASDVATPELKNTYQIDDADYRGHSPSGRYVIYKDTSSEHDSDNKLHLFDSKDGSQYGLGADPQSGDSDYVTAYCFSADEDNFYYIDGDSRSVVAFDLSTHKSKEYPLGATVPDDVLDDLSDHDDVKIRLQVSKDKEAFYITTVYYDDRDEATKAVLSVFDYQNNNITAKYEYSTSEKDDYRIEGPAWISNDGRYGYVVCRYSGDDYDDNKDYEVVTVDLKSKKVANTSPCDGAGGAVAVNDSGAAIGTGCYVSKKGKATSAYYSNLEYESLNPDGSLAFGLYNAKSRYLGSSSSQLSSLEMIIVDNKTGKTKWKTKYPNDLWMGGGRYTDPISEYGAITNDGSYVLGNVRDENDNDLLYLIDTKTGANSHINLRGTLADNYGSNTESSYFSKDSSKIYVVQEENDGIRLDIYKSGISKNAASKSAQGKGHASAVNPVFIVLGVAVVVAAGVGGFFIVRARKGSKNVVTSVANVAAPAASKPTVPQTGDDQQAPTTDNAPKFCASCGTPLVPGARFCPHCGAPVKR